MICETDYTQQRNKIYFKSKFFVEIRKIPHKLKIQ